jgi:hypothetical protein
MNVFSVLGHLGLLIHMGKDIQAIVENLVQKKEQFPSKEEFKALLDDAIEFLNSGILSLPDDVKAKMVSALMEVKTQLFPVAAAAN